MKKIMNAEFFEALGLMGEENGLSSEQLAEIIKQGITKAIKKDNPNCENIRVEINPETGVFEMGILKLVVDDEPLDDYNEINIDEARTIDPDCHVGGMCLIKVSPATFGRGAVSNAKQQIKHELKNHERERLIEQFNDKLYECVTAKVERIEGRTGNAVLSLDKSEVYLVQKEQIPGEILEPGKAGARSKLAVRSKDENVDAIGACIGPKKSRITAVVQELGGEKIDIIPYSEDPEEFIARALAPAQVISVTINHESENPECRVVVPANQLSLAIGNRGQNARLAAGLTGYKIDIISDLQEKELKKQAEEQAAAAENESADELIAPEEEAVDDVISSDELAAALEETTDSEA